MTKKALQQKVTDAKQLEIIKKSGITKAKNPTYMDFLIASVIMKSIKKGSVDDILKYQQIIGEKPNIEASPALDTLEAILKGLKDNAETETEPETK